jgi:hypothetical protein
MPDTLDRDARTVAPAPPSDPCSGRRRRAVQPVVVVFKAQIARTREKLSLTDDNTRQQLASPKHRSFRNERLSDFSIGLHALAPDKEPRSDGDGIDASSDSTVTDTIV